MSIRTCSFTSRRLYRNGARATLRFSAIMLFMVASLLFGASSAAGESDKAASALEAAWDQASASGAYSFKTKLRETERPLAVLKNAGRRVTTRHMEIEGQLDKPGETIEVRMTFGSGGSIELLGEEGRFMGRRAETDEWTEVEGLGTDLFAPQGDPMAFLGSAKNVQLNEEPLDSVVAASAGVMGQKVRRLQFEVDGERFARNLRDQLREDLERRGRCLPAFPWIWRGSM